jgi:hypothetical protein
MIWQRAVKARIIPWGRWTIHRMAVCNRTHDPAQDGPIAVAMR